MVAQPIRGTVALVGNPNTGKTTLFNALSGLNHHVGNYPGVTVESRKGHMTCADGGSFAVIDLPGTYSLAPRSPDEMVAVDVILGQQSGEPRPDVVVSIVDASNLDRNLYLTTQALELGVPVVVALNMVDLAASQGIIVDHLQLARNLGVPVVPIQANRRVGLDALRQAVAQAVGTGPPPCRPPFPAPFEEEVRVLAGHLDQAHQPQPDYLVRRLILDVGGFSGQRLTSLGPASRVSQAGSRVYEGGGLADHVSAARERLAQAGCPVPAVEARARYGWIKQITAGCVRRPAHRAVTWTDRLDRVLTHRLWGTLVFLVVMFGVFESIFLAAKPLMDLISSGRGWLADLVRDSLPAGPFTSLLADGVVEGVGAVVVFLPQILILFGFIGLLEDCGYMARAAFLMDRIMARCGLSGKSFIPLLSSLACAVPGIMATRVIEDRRDRLATILVAPLMSCSARLPLYTLLIGAFLTEGRPWWLPGLVMFGLYAIGLVTAPLVALALKRTLLRGQTPVFVMEMPAYKVPSWRGILRRMFDSGTAFLRRAGTLILATMVLVWAALYFPAGHPDGGPTYPERLTALEAPLKADRQALQEAKAEVAALTGPEAEAGKAELDARVAGLEARLGPAEAEIHALELAWKEQTVLGRLGHAIEPAVRPLGWDWRVGVAALASFPAREVVVGTLGIVYQLGKVDTGEVVGAANVGDTDLGREVRANLSTAGAVSLLVFFALCCQCASTLAVIRRETRSWAWPAFTFAYMTALAYVAALVVYQIGSRL